MLAEESALSPAREKTDPFFTTALAAAFRSRVPAVTGPAGGSGGRRGAGRARRGLTTARRSGVVRAGVPPGQKADFETWGVSGACLGSSLGAPGAFSPRVRVSPGHWRVFRTANLVCKARG